MKTLTLTVLMTAMSANCIAANTNPNAYNLKAGQYYNVEPAARLSSRDFSCLARNIYYEAGVESFKGKLAVAQVTLNRVGTGQWGDDICKVVYSKHQFSWTATKKRRETPSGTLWEESMLAASMYANGLRIAGLENSLHYHRNDVNPDWNNGAKKVAKIGKHLFYAHVD